jgi:hypothetical protein
VVTHASALCAGIDWAGRQRRRFAKHVFAEIAISEEYRAQAARS